MMIPCFVGVALLAFLVAADSGRPSDFIKGSLHSWSLFRRDDVPWRAATFAAEQCAAAPAPARDKPIVYLALFVTGGGSTILCTLLNDQGVPCVDEPNLRLAWFTDVDGATVALNEARTAFRAHPLRPLSSPDAASRVVGAKVKLERPSQMPRELITALLDSDAKRSLPFDLRFVFLHRRDLVRHTVGLIRKRHLPPVVVASAADNSTVKIVHAEGYGNAYRGRVTPAIHIALPEYVNYLFHVINAAKALLVRLSNCSRFVCTRITLIRPLQDFEAAMRAKQFATLRLVYEDNLVLPSQWNATAECVVRFLTGARAKPVLIDSSWPVKNTQLNMSADVTNFDEVREFTLELQSVIALGAQLDWPKQKPRNRSPFAPELFNNNE
jgi:hypothetical protein